MNSNENVKPTLKSRLEDIWDTYKWLVILGACGVVALVVVCFQIFTASEARIRIMYTGSSYLDEYDRSRLQSNAKVIDTTLLTEGKSVVDLLELTVQTKLSDDGNFIYDQTMLTRFNAEVRTCESIIYIVEPSYYEKLLDGGFVAPLNTVLDEYPEEAAADEYGLVLSMLDISSLPGFDSFDPSCVLCIRRPVADGEIKYIDDAVYDANHEFFIKMVEYVNESDASSSTEK